MLLAASLSLLSAPGYAEEASSDSAKRAIALTDFAPKAVSNQTGTKSGQSKSHHTNNGSYAALAKKGYPRSHMEKGLYLKQKSDLNGALIEFLNATQENPRLVKGFYEQALIFRERGYRKLAESALEQALALKPDYTEARILLATVRLEQGNLGGAVQELSKSLGLPNDSKETAETSPSGQAISPSKNEVTADTGLLSAALPAILQSVHGVLQPALAAVSPPPKLQSELTSSTNSTSTANSNESEARPEQEQKQSQEQYAKNLHRKGKTRDRAKKVKTEKERPAKETAEDILAALNASANAENASNEANKESNSASDANGTAKKGKKKKHKRNFLAHLKRGDEMEQPGDEIMRLSKERTGSKSDDSFKLPWELDRTTDSQTKQNEALSHQTSGTEEKTSDGTLRSESKDEQARPATAATSEPPPSIFGAGFSSNTGTNSGLNSTFSARPNMSQAKFLGGVFTSSASNSAEQNLTSTQESQPADETAKPAKLVKLDSDEWAKKLKYYVDHGTNSLKDGEAFMFAEDTGEASLFLADGTTIRRIVQQPKDAQDVMRQRRPDIAANADDMLFGLSLLGKLIPKFDMSTPAVSAPSVISQQSEPLGTFHGDNLMSNSQTFWGWLKTVLKF